MYNGRRIGCIMGEELDVMGEELDVINGRSIRKQLVSG